LRVLVAAGVTSLALQLALSRGSVSDMVSDTVAPDTVASDAAAGWVEGAAILGAVAVVATVTAINDYQKQAQFEALNAVAESTETTLARRDGAEVIGTAAPSRVFLFISHWSPYDRVGVVNFIIP
jgi:Ca2+ transporting ATPase